jgi:hypothetical protein
VAVSLSLAESNYIHLDVENRDARAGGATEAEESGVPLEDIQNGLTHTSKTTTLRYIRRRTTKIANVALARQQSRTASDDGTA